MEWPIVTGWPTITLARAVFLGLLGGSFAFGFVIGTMGFLWLSKRPVLDPDMDRAGRVAFPEK